MDNPKRVESFLRKNEKITYCDDCLEKHTGVDRHEVNTIARTLALFPKHFTRTPGVCSQGCSTRNKELTAAI